MIEDVIQEAVRRAVHDELQPVLAALKAAGASTRLEAQGPVLSTYRGAARKFDCSESVLRKWRSQGKLTRYGEGRLVRVDEREVYELLRSGSAEARRVETKGEPLTADQEAEALLAKKRK